MTNIDWKTQGNRDYDELYPKGTYKVRINNWMYCKARTGTDQVRWFASIVEPAEFDGKTIVEHTALGDKALWRLAKFISAAGLDINTLPKMEIKSPIFDGVLDSIKGQTLFWHVDQHTFNGKTKNNILDYQPDPDTGSVPFSSPKDSVPSFAKEE